MAKGSNKGNKWNKRVFLAGVIAIFMAIIVGLLVAFESQKDNPDLQTLYENIVISIMCSIVASIIYTIMQRGFSNSDDRQIMQQLQQIEDSLQRQNELYDSGVISIHPKTHFDNEESYWNNIINGTNKRLDLIGHSISNWFKREYKSIFVAKLRQILESGNSVNIVLSASKVDFILIKEVFLNEQNENKLNKVEKTILYLCRILGDIPEEKRKYLNVYISDLEKITYLYIRTDEQCIISPYIYSMDSNNNSFLLELRPRTSYVKSLEDDFEEMINDLEQVDLSLDEYNIGDNNLIQLRQEKTRNRYSGSNWNLEKTEKYIYGNKFKKYEVGYFEHYLDEQFIKAVIELPISYGCPSKCLYCASSNIENFEILKSDQMFFLFNEIYEAKNLNKYKEVLLSLTGTGDIFFNEDNVFSFLSLLKEYKNLSITLSSSFWDIKLLERAVQLKEILKVRYIQLTYTSDSYDILPKLIPLHNKRNTLPNLSEFIEYVSKIEDTFFRINYIVILDINDFEEAVYHFIEKTKGIKEKIVIRISKLNETNATIRNNLQATTIDKLNYIKDIFIKEGFKCYVFYSYENDNMNCGQLLTETS